MIDPRKVTDFERTSAELEEFLLFSIVVAGKNAFVQAKKLDDFLWLAPYSTPFETIRKMDEQGNLVWALKAVKMGQYERVSNAFRGVANFFSVGSNITLSLPLLECIKGVGMKTARFFFMHTMPNQRYACLDTHILQWLGERGHEVPKMTPRGEKYLELEKVFLGYCESMQKSPAELDLEIWNSRHQEKKEKNVRKNLTVAYSSAIVMA